MSQWWSWQRLWFHLIGLIKQASFEIGCEFLEKDKSEWGTHGVTNWMLWSQLLVMLLGLYEGMIWTYAYNDNLTYRLC